jgi:hypothetical protein
MYAISRLSEQGNTIFDWAAVCLDSCNLLSVTDSTVAKTAKRMISEGKLAPFPKAKRISTANLYNAEKSIFEWVKACLN